MHASLTTAVLTPIGLPVVGYWKLPKVFSVNCLPDRMFVVGGRQLPARPRADWAQEEDTSWITKIRRV